MFLTTLNAQPNSIQPRHHEWNAFITQDSRNLTWVSSLKHWNVYDGNEVRSFGDPTEAERGGYIQSELFEDEDGKLWYSTEKGIYFLDPKYETINSVLLPRYLEGSFFAFCLNKEHGELWFADNNHIWTYSLETGRVKNLPFKISSVRFGISFFPDGNLKSIGGALYSNGKGFELLTRTEPNGEWSYQRILQRDGIKFDYVRSLVFAGPSVLYLGTENGLFSYEMDIDKISQIASGTIHDLSLHNTSQFLSSSVLAEGLITYSLDTTGIIKKIEGESPRSNTFEIYHDSQQRLWEHRPGTGITYTPNETKLFTTDFPGLESHSLIDIHLAASGHLFALSQNGITFILDQSTNSWIEVYHAPAGRKYTAISSDLHSLFLHSAKSIVRVVQKKPGLLDGTLANSVPKLFQQLIHHEDGSSLVLDFNSIYHFDKNDLVWSEPSLPYFNGFPSFSFDYMKYLGDGNLVLDHASKELMVLNWEKGKVSLEESIQIKRDITCVVRGWSGDELFIGTNSGLYVSKGNGGFVKIMPSLSLSIKSIQKTEEGQLVLGTDNGLVIYDDKTQRHQRYFKEDGLPDNNFIVDAVVKTGDGEIWILTTGGLMSFHPEELPVVCYSYQPRIKNIWINNLMYQDTLSYGFVESLNLSYRENTLNFQLANTGYEHVSRSSLDFRLKGYDNDWVNIKNGGDARFTKIAPGDYIFEVRSKDTYGNVSGYKELRITISPPFYQTWWFWTICGTGLFALFYSLNRRAVHRETARQQAIQKEEARKADETLKRHQAVVSEQRRIMMELHDDLGGTLGSLFYTLDGYLLDKESGLPVQPDFELLKNTSGDALKQLREVMKNNIARELPLPVFIRTLTEQARMMASSSRLNWELEKDDLFPELQLSSRQVHNALLIVKEALQNIRKHAQASSFVLKMHLRKPDEMLCITLTDDGTGMEEQTALHQREDGTGNGLVNMRRRAEDLGGDLHLSTPPSGGTSLQLSFPLK